MVVEVGSPEKGFLCQGIIGVDFRQGYKITGGIGILASFPLGLGFLGKVDAAIVAVTATGPKENPHYQEKGCPLGKLEALWWQGCD